MTDRGAIESIAEVLCPRHCMCRAGGGYWAENPATGEAKSRVETGGVCTFHLIEAQRILDRLTADGWALVKVEEQEARDLAFHSGCRLCGIRDLTQPYVPAREFKRIHTNCLRRVLADLGDDFIKRLRAEPVLEGGEDEQ